MPLIRIELTNDEYELVKEVANKARFNTAESFVGYIIINLAHAIEEGYNKGKNPIDILEFIFTECLEKFLQT